MFQQKSISRTVLWLVGIIAIVLGLTVYKYAKKPTLTQEELQQLGAVVFEKPRQIAITGLVDHTNQPFTSENTLNRWTLGYFGYTFCPDICPTTLSQLNQLDILLKKQDSAFAEKMQYIMVTVDPRRDTVEKMKGYVPYFNPNFIGVTGGLKDTHNLAVQMNIPYTPVTNPKDEFYLVDHGANLVIINPQGQYHGFLRPPFDAEKLAKVMKAIDEQF